MPPKRKALAVADANKELGPPPAKRVTRGSAAAAVCSNREKEKAKENVKGKGKGKEVEEKVEKEVEKVVEKKVEKQMEKGTGKVKGKATKSKKSSKETKGAQETQSVKKAEISGPEAGPKAGPEAIKATEGTKAPRAPKAPKAKKFKYSDPETLINIPPLEFVNVAWPQKKKSDGEDDSHEGGQPGDPKVGDILTDDMVKRVSNMGYPITEDGIAKFQWLVEEEDKRDQNLHGMYIYNDFSGYGTSEVMENFLANFNKIIFKRDVSPFRKWAFVEGLATFFRLSYVGHWMMTDDSEGLVEILDMIGTMVLTSFSMLAEHDLLSATSPLPNISITSLLLLEFLKRSCADLEILWGREVVRALDNAGIELVLRKEVRVSQEHIDELRASYRENEKPYGFSRSMDFYEFFGTMPHWDPEIDREDGKRRWWRWDWRREYSIFRDDHAGGNHYNLEKWSKRDKAPYTFGTAEYEMLMSF